VTANVRIPSKVEHAVTAQSTAYHDGFYAVPTIVDTDGLSLTSSKVGFVIEAQR
jgi:hypothetical protein